MKRTKRSRKVSVGSLVNRLELSIALAAMRKDTAAEAKFTRALEAAINSTNAPAFVG